MTEESTHHCTQCKKKRPGRFTRRRGTSSQGWSQGFALPYWYCFTCLPFGDGRDEDAMAKKPITSKDVAPAVTINQDQIKQQGLEMIRPLSEDVDALVVTTQDEYLIADSLRHRVKSARKTWGERMEKIIRPIRQGLDEIYGLNREVDRPLEALEASITDKMKTFKIAEARQIRLAEEKKEAEAKRLREEADAKLRQAQQAKTPQMQGRLEAAAARAQQQAVAVAQEEMPAPVQGINSTTRPVQKVKVGNHLHFLQGVIDGYVPEDCLTDIKVQAAIQTVLNRYFKDDPEGMKAWPGIEVYDDVQIVGR